LSQNWTNDLEGIILASQSSFVSDTDLIGLDWLSCCTTPSRRCNSETFLVIGVNPIKALFHRRFGDGVYVPVAEATHIRDQPVGKFKAFGDETSDRSFIREANNQEQYQCGNGRDSSIEPNDTGSQSELPRGRGKLTATQLAARMIEGTEMEIAPLKTRFVP
jgi:hypothetical protein